MHLRDKGIDPLFARELVTKRGQCHIFQAAVALFGRGCYCAPAGTYGRCARSERVQMRELGQIQPLRGSSLVEKIRNPSEQKVLDFSSPSREREREKYRGINYDQSHARRRSYCARRVWRSRCPRRIFSLQLLTSTSRNSVHGPFSTRHCLPVANTSTGSRR